MRTAVGNAPGNRARLKATDVPGCRHCAAGDLVARSESDRVPQLVAVESEAISALTDESVYRSSRALLFTRRITGHIVPCGKLCLLFPAGKWTTMEMEGRPRLVRKAVL